MQVMKITGHTQMQTFVRYIEANEQAAQRVATALDEWQTMTVEREAEQTGFIN